MEIYQLSNGLKIYLNKVKDKKVISCGVWIKQGAKYEDNYTSGLSHLVEHMMFRTKSKESTLSLDDCLNEILKKGAFYNASTSKDNTYFYVEGLSQDYEMLIKALSLMVVNKDKISEEELTKEKEVVLREAETHFMSTRQMPDRIGQALWNDKYYGNPVIGSCENIKRFTTDMIDEVIEKFYTPDNSYIVISGGFEIDEVKEKIESYFGVWKGKCKKREEYKIKLQPHLLIDDRFKGNRSTVGIGFEGYSFSNYKSLYLELLSDYLLSSDGRLLRILRDEKGLLYSLNGYVNAFYDTGNIGLVFSANNESVEEIIKVIINELKNLIDFGIDKEKFESLKRKKLVETLLVYEQSTEMFISIGKAAANDNIFLANDYIKNIELLNYDKMQEIIKEVFEGKDAAMAVLGCADCSNVEKLLKEI
ncbi:MAG: insulinase family protein [Clostridium sp.]|jgi:predicted Zn-dependent peptidase|nr:insulinase family protein [Clostridium sp.]